MTELTPEDFTVIRVESDIPGMTIAAAVQGSEISKRDADKLRRLAAEFHAETES